MRDYIKKQWSRKQLHVVGPQIPVVGVAFLQFGKNLCKESLINDENWKNAYTKGYVLSFIIGGGGSGSPGSPPPPPPPPQFNCVYKTHAPWTGVYND